MLNLLSIGPACGVRANINKYFSMHNHGEPTYFFDWILSQFDDVLKILDIENIDETFNIENLIQTDKGTVIKSISSSVIDVHNGLTKDSSKLHFNLLCDKYKRRYLRFIDKLKNTKDLILIYQDDTNIITIDRINTLFQKLDLINPNNNIKIMLVGDGDCTIVLPNKCKYINRLLYRIPNIASTWDQNEYNWINMIKEMELI